MTNGVGNLNLAPFVCRTPLEEHPVYRIIKNNATGSEGATFYNRRLLPESIAFWYHFL